MTEPTPTQLPIRSLFRLDGRTILISGGAGAVGATVAGAILESGGDVVLLDRVAPTSEVYRVLSDSAKASDTKVWYHQVKVEDEASITATMDNLRLRHPIRGFVSCAAMFGESDACNYSIDVFRKILDINISGTFLMARAAANAMHKANVTGSIVLIASISGHGSNRGLNTSPYNASKAAVHQLARSLAAEWGHAQNTFPTPSLGPRSVYPLIRVNTLSPGHIETPITEAARVRGLTEEWAKQNMLGRISQPEEYRAAVLFLLGEGSSYMTGADLRIDGGHCAW